MPVSDEIREMVTKLAHGTVGRDELAQWLAVRSWSLYHSPNRMEVKFISELDVAHSEVQLGCEDESHLQRMALWLLRKIDSKSSASKSKRLPKTSAVGGGAGRRL